VKLKKNKYRLALASSLSKNTAFSIEPLWGKYDRQKKSQRVCWDCFVVCFNNIYFLYPFYAIGTKQNEVGQVATAVTQMSAATQEIAGNAEQTALASNETVHTSEVPEELANTC